MKKHTEARLEDAIVDSLAQQDCYAAVDYRQGLVRHATMPAFD